MTKTFDLPGLLGLVRPWKITSAHAAEGRARLAVSRPGEEAVLVLRRTTREPCYARAGETELCFEGKETSKEVERLLGNIADSIRHTAFDEILKRMPRETAGGGAAGDATPDATCISDRLGGNPGQWRRFFCRREFDRVYHWINSVGFTGDVLYIVHGDHECSSIPPDYAYQGLTFLNYPPVHPHLPETALPGTAYAEWSTALKEGDVVMGSGDKLRALEAVLAEEARRRDLIVLAWGCTPTVTGDDMDATLERARAKGGCPILVNSIQFRMGKEPSLLGELLKALRARPGFLKVRRRKGALDLVDCPGRFFDEELSGPLERLGLSVNVRLIPDVPVRALSRYMAAECQFLPERFKNVKGIQQSLGALPLRTVYTPPPFGLKGSREYVSTIAEAFGKKAPFRRTPPGWDALCRKARSFRLAFVADEEGLAVLSDPAFQMGVPVLGMLDEMGFGIDILAYGPAGKAFFPRLSRRPRISTFSDATGLERLLREGDFRAVYSDIQYDHRISESGKAQFSMRFFEPGALGAVRSLERLLGVCRLDFFQKYGVHLGKTGTLSGQSP